MQIVVANDSAILNQLDLAVEHLCWLCVTWQPNIVPIPCPKALPSSWGPLEQQLQDVAAYTVMADWTVVDDWSKETNVGTSDQEECLDKLGTEMANLAGYLVGKFLDSVKVVGLVDAYRSETGLDLHLDYVDLDISTSRASSSPQKHHRAE